MTLMPQGPGTKIVNRGCESNAAAELQDAWGISSEGACPFYDNLIPRRRSQLRY